MNSASQSPVTSIGGLQAVLVACFAVAVVGATEKDAFGDSDGPAASRPGYQRVEISDNFVTLQAHNAGVREVLDEIARKSDLIIVAPGPLHGWLTLEFERQPFDEALRRILRGRSYLLHQARPAAVATIGSHDRRSTLWIFSSGPAGKSGQLGAGGGPDSEMAVVIAALQTQLMSDDVRVRQEAIGRLRQLGVHEVIAPLSYALTDEDQKTRVKAIYALADVGGEDAAAAMAAAAVDENPWVREETAYALGTLGGNTAIQILKLALDDTDSAVRGSAIEAFTDIGGGESAAALAVALRDADASLRVDAVEALAEIGGEAAMRLLHQALENRDDAVRIAASEALAELQDEDQ